jgi:hypothetical protein
MIKLVDIYTSVNKLLYSKYPKTTYKIYGHEVTEGYKTPSFFVDLIPKSILKESINYKKNTYTITITYFQSTANEIDNLTKADEIKELFGYHLTIDDRKALITDYSYDFVGENTNVLQVSIDIEYFEANERVDTHVTANNLILNEEKR